MTIADDIRAKQVQYRGLSNKELSEKLAADGCCTHYPGYTCDKNFSDPATCPPCIRRWLGRKVKEV